MARACSANGKGEGEEKKAYRLLTRKLKGKRPLGRRTRGWVSNIECQLEEIGWGVIY
jgi:hypothetical protein